VCVRAKVGEGGGGVNLVIQEGVAGDFDLAQLVPSRG
jgi:hypothetical protein